MRIPKNTLFGLTNSNGLVSRFNINGPSSKRFTLASQWPGCLHRLQCRERRPLWDQAGRMCATNGRVHNQSWFATCRVHCVDYVQLPYYHIGPNLTSIFQGIYATKPSLSTSIWTKSSSKTGSASAPCQFSIEMESESSSTVLQEGAKQPDNGMSRLNPVGTPCMRARKREITVLQSRGKRR